MTLPELSEKHKKEWEAYFEGYTEASDKLYQEKCDILDAFGGRRLTIPEVITKMMESNHQQWQEEWGIDGTRARDLHKAQFDEINVFFREQDKRNEIIRSLQTGHEKKADRGR